MLLQIITEIIYVNSKSVASDGPNYILIWSTKS